jgi:hypothetical protein
VFSKIWKSIKKFIGTIATVALTPFLGPLAVVIGSAIGAAVNGGTWKSFAIGVGIGIAAGAIANGIGGHFGGGVNAFKTWAEIGIGVFAAGALTGAVSGAISSAVYGGNWGDNMLARTMGGAIGAGVGIITSGVLEIGQRVIAGISVTIEQMFPKPEMQEMFGWGINGDSIDWNSYNYGTNAISPTRYGYGTQHEAARAAHAELTTLAKADNWGHEFGTFVYKSNGLYGYVEPEMSAHSYVGTWARLKLWDKVPFTGRITALAHNHPAPPLGYRNDFLSGSNPNVSSGVGVFNNKGDLPYALSKGIDIYMTAQNGKFQYFNHVTQRYKYLQP